MLHQQQEFNGLSEKELQNMEALKYTERELFCKMCVTISQKDFEITSHDLIKYVSQVCDGFKERFSK